MKIKKIDGLLFPVLAFISSLVVYMITLRPCVGWFGDSAKFQFMGKVLGIAGPTGYPAYMLINRLFTLIPFGSLALKVSLLSAVFGSLTIVVLWFLLKRITGNKLVSFVAVMFFAISYTFWSQCNVPEVYTLNSFLISLVILCLILWSEEGRAGYLLLACFLYFMNFGIHIMTILFLPAILYFVIATDRRILLERGIMVFCLAFALLAALQYSYLFARSIYSKPYFEYDVFSIKEFLWRMSGGEFRGMMFSNSLKTVMLEKLPLYLSFLYRQFALPGVALGFAGLCLFLRNRRKYGIFLFLIFAGNVVFSLGYEIHDIGVYFLPSYLVFSIFIGYALSEVLKIDFKLISKKLWQPALISFIAILIVSLGFRNAPYLDERNNRFTDGFIDAVLENVEDNSIILIPEYHWLKFYHFKTIGEQKRRGDDVHLMWNWFPEDIMVSYIGYLLEDVPARVRRSACPVPYYRIKAFHLLGSPSVPPAADEGGWNIYFQDEDINRIREAGLKFTRVLCYTQQGQSNNLYRITSGRSGKKVDRKAPVVIKHVEPDEGFSFKKLLLALTRTISVTKGVGDRGYFIDGWAYTEPGKAGESYCWAVGEESSLFVPLNRTGNYRMSLRACPVIYENAPARKIKVLVNDMRASEVELADEWKTYYLDIPERFWKKGRNIITFRCSHSISPYEQSISIDPRKFAFALKYMRLSSSSSLTYRTTTILPIFSTLFSAVSAVILYKYTPLATTLPASSFPSQSTSFLPKFDVTVKVLISLPDMVYIPRFASSAPPPNSNIILVPSEGLNGLG